MPQRVFWLNAPDESWVSRLRAERGLRAGPLHGQAAPEAALLDAALAAGLAACSVGVTRKVTWPSRYRGLALETTGAGWRVHPASRQAGVARALDGISGGPARQVLEAAARLLLLEPWDLFVLNLPADGTADSELPARVARELAALAADVMVVATAPGAWSASGTAGALPAARAEDLAPTLLSLLGAGIPTGMSGQALPLTGNAAPAGYSAAEEQEIQKRLEDLGYV